MIFCMISIAWFFSFFPLLLHVSLFLSSCLFFFLHGLPFMVFFYGLISRFCIVSYSMHNFFYYYFAWLCFYGRYSRLLHLKPSIHILYSWFLLLLFQCMTYHGLFFAWFLSSSTWFFLFASNIFGLFLLSTTGKKALSPLVLFHFSPSTLYGFPSTAIALALQDCSRW